jgi:hypothetical protein
MDHYRHHPQAIRARELARAAGLNPYARMEQEKPYWGRWTYWSFMDAAFEEHFARVAIDNIFWDQGGCSYTERWHIPDRDGDCSFGYGRCKSGKRWFWCVRGWIKGEPSTRVWDDRFNEHGYANTEAEALATGTAAIKRFAAGRRAIVRFQHGQARYELKKINEAKRTARWSDAPPDGSDTRAAEYLYNQWGDKFRITKKTAKRIFYVKEKSYGYEHGEIGFVSRDEVADDWPGPTWRELRDLQEKVGWRNAPKVFLKPLPPGFHDRDEPPIDLARLKAEMAAAHPDKGGSSAAFIEARQRYVEARRHMRKAAP